MEAPDAANKARNVNMRLPDPHPTIWKLQTEGWIKLGVGMGLLVAREVW